MAKWLIRTHTNHLLGPISKAKLQELIALRSLGSRDEVCSGNGYWFNLEESDLVDRFINGEERQPFNPLSEHQVEDTQTGFINLKDIKAPNGQVNQGSPIVELTEENLLGDLLPPDEDMSGVNRPSKPSEKEQSSLPEENVVAKKGSFLNIKTLLFIFIIMLATSGYLLKDKILEFQQDLNFFNNTTSFQIIPTSYAQSSFPKNELRVKKK